MTALLEPTSRGYRVPGGGYDPYIRVPPTRRASTLTARRLYPFSVGMGLPKKGLPVGKVIGERGGQTFCCDPLTWFEDLDLISNPSAGILGLNGWGKSGLAKRWVGGLAAFGVLPVIPGDTKGEYVNQIRAMISMRPDPRTGIVIPTPGQVIRVGPGHYLNLLDMGSAPAAAARLGKNSSAGRTLLAAAKRRRQLRIEGFIGVLRGSTPDELELDLLAVALRLLDKAWERKRSTPLPSDLAAVFASSPVELREAAMWRDNIDNYYQAVTHLERNIGALARGSGIAEPFSKPTSVQMQPDLPTVFDLSGIARSDSKLRAAAQITCWAYAFGEIAVSQALSEAGVGSYPGDPYRVRTFLSILDELWDMMRSGVGMAGLIDALGRLNRTDKLVDVKISHSMTDTDHSLTAEDAAIATGLFERCGFLALAALPPSEHSKLRSIAMCSDLELETNASWATPPSLASGGGGVPNGVGKMLYKLRNLPGVPVKNTLMPVEKSYVETSQKWSKAHA